MPITCEWDNAAHTVIRWTYASLWTIDDLLAADAIMNDLLESVDHPVGVLFTVMEDSELPKGILGRFNQFADTSGLSHPNVAMMIIVGLTGLPRRMADIFSKLYRHRDIVVVDSVDEAYDLFKERHLLL
ncbi:MAG: hypothetical protein GYB68_12655 [Chloroflexi bacterium]|nr:hypothetical protein [Chloroflexota bacterium]